VKHSLHQLVHLIQDQNPRIVGGIAGGALLAAGVIWYVIRSRRPSAEEMERRRRERLATIGRITDGHIVDARTLSGEDSVSPTPEVLVYSYRLAGVTYDCAQDVSLLPDPVRGYRLDQPVQIRYDPHNPGNSILVAESWSGLWQAKNER
jgi:hypothetical protein